MNSLSKFLIGACNVLFVKSGCEQKITGKLRELFSNEFPGNNDIKVFVPLYEKVLSKRGITQTESGILFPGYIFVFAMPELNLNKITGISNVFHFLMLDGKLLEVPEDEWHLLGELCNENGIIETSIIDFDVNNRIEVIESPLKNLTGNIVSVNKHKRYVIVEIKMMNSSKRIQLSFEFLRKLEIDNSKGVTI